MVATGILATAGWEDLLARGLALVVGLSLFWAAIMAAVGVRSMMGIATGAGGAIRW